LWSVVLMPELLVEMMAVELDLLQTLLVLRRA